MRRARPRVRGHRQWAFASMSCSRARSFSRLGGVIGCEISHVLIAQRGRDATHGWMLAGALLVVLQSLDDVCRLLAADLRDRIDRWVGGPIVDDAVTSFAHLGSRSAACRI